MKEYINKFMYWAFKQPHKWLKDSILVGSSTAFPAMKAVIVDKPGTDRIEVPIYTFRWIMKREDLPTPKKLAEFLDEFLWRLVCGVDYDDPIMKHKPLGAHSTRPKELKFTTPCPTTITHKLIVRWMWEIDVSQEFETGDELVSIYGRYGVMPKELK